LGHQSSIGIEAGSPFEAITASGMKNVRKLTEIVRQKNPELKMCLLRIETRCPTIRAAVAKLDSEGTELSKS